MKTRITLVIVLFSLLSAEIKAAPSQKTDACDFKSDMCMLWEQHIQWTRNVIFNIIDSLPGTNEAVARLLQNQVDIGNAIKPYYGAAAGDSLSRLLTNHILGAATMLNALVNNDQQAFETADSIWYLNADTIAHFLSNANPNWTFAGLHDMLFEHLELTEDEVVARLNGDYAADITAYDAIQQSILEMCDMLSTGIIAQFHNRFHGSAKKDPQEVVLENMSMVMDQNVPNPFTEKTTITYTLPESVGDAQIIFTDVNGRVINSVKLEQRGDGELDVFTANLSKGFYSYSIIADGKTVDTKRMIRQ